MKKSIIGILSLLFGCAGGIIGSRKLIVPKLNNAIQYSDKHLSLFLMMNQWVKVKQEGKNLSTYFLKNGYKRIAVYGMSYVGETLVKELNGTEIEIVYAIDKNAENIYSSVDIVSLEDPMENVDAVVITAITFLEEIENQLSKKLSCPLLSLEDILYEV